MYSILITQLTTEKAGEIDDSKIGGNASAEGGEEEKAEASSVSGCNIVLANRLVQTSYSKKDYGTHIKVLCLCAYMYSNILVNYMIGTRQHIFLSSKHLLDLVNECFQASCCGVWYSSRNNINITVCHKIGHSKPRVATCAAATNPSFSGVHLGYMYG